MEKWIATAVGKMHICGITQTDVAIKFGCTREYVNRILNGSVKASNDTKDRILSAIDAIVAERKSDKPYS